jgi:hypothetical protein
VRAREGQQEEPPLSDERPAQMRRPPLVVVGGTPPAHRGRVRGRRRAAAVRARGLTGRRVSRWEERRGTGLGATTASLRRRSWRARLTRRLRASVRAATPMKRVEASRGVVSLHGHKDLRRPPVRQQRRANGRKVGTIGPPDPTPGGNIVASAAIRPGTDEEGHLENEQRQPPDVWCHQPRDGGLERGSPGRWRGVTPPTLGSATGRGSSVSAAALISRS